MLHNTINIDLPYQEFGIEQQEMQQLLLTSKMYFLMIRIRLGDLLLLSVRVADIIIILQEKEKL